MSEGGVIQTLLSAQVFEHLLPALLLLWGLFAMTNPARASAGHGKSDMYRTLIPTGSFLAVMIYALGVALLAVTIDGATDLSLDQAAIAAAGGLLVVLGGLATIWPKPRLPEDEAPGQVLRMIFFVTRWMVGPMLIVFALGFWGAFGG